MKMPAILLAIASIALPSATAFAYDASLLTPFFGVYKVESYNGVKNNFTRRFFVPSINIEPSLKVKQENGETFHTLNFNFEVPTVQENFSIALKYLFAEMPLDGTVITSVENGVELSYSGKIQELKANEEWAACEAHYRLKLSRLSEKQLLISLEKKADAPCREESHEIVADFVRAVM